MRQSSKSDNVSHIEKDYKRLAYLSFYILELKLAYYHIDLVHKSWHKSHIVSDKIYDDLENEYRALATKLGHPPTAADAVGFPFGRPSADLVAEKLRRS